MSEQLSFAVKAGVLVASGCSHRAAATASGWHQTAHSSEALGSTARISTIERTAARNTLMLTLLRAKPGPRQNRSDEQKCRTISSGTTFRTLQAAGFRR